jgi:DNA-binding NarL/FixJ family response regulator
MLSMSQFQQQVLTLVASGLSDKEIGASLKRTEEDVQNCLVHLLQVLGLSERLELIFLFHSERWKRALQKVA